MIRIQIRNNLKTSIKRDDLSLDMFLQNPTSAQYQKNIIFSPVINQKEAPTR